MAFFPSEATSNSSGLEGALAGTNGGHDSEGPPLTPLTHFHSLHCEKSYWSSREILKRLRLLGLSFFVQCSYKRCCFPPIGETKVCLQEQYAFLCSEGGVGWSIKPSTQAALLLNTIIKTLCLMQWLLFVWRFHFSAPTFTQKSLQPINFGLVGYC